MEQIKSNDAKTEERPKSYGEVIEQSTAKKKKLVRSAINYIGTAVAMFIIFVAIVVSTTDLTIMTTIDWAELGLSFFVFMFCAYAMYVNGTGSGIRAGRKSEAYLASKKQYDDLKDQIIKNKMQGRLPGSGSTFRFIRQDTSAKIKKICSGFLSSPKARSRRYWRQTG